MFVSFVAAMAALGGLLFGALVSLYQFAITIGILGAYIVDLWLTPGGDWRAMLGLAIVPAALFVAGMLAMPETPRWLFAHDRGAAGRVVLERSLPADQVDAAVQEIGAGELLGPALRAPMTIAVGLAVLQQITGINVWLLISEVFPLRVRGRGMSVATLANWAANFVVSLVFLGMLEALGTAATFLVYAALCVATIAFTAKFVPETIGRELETISESRAA